MLQYILESLAFQLAFLLVYDLFLKKETFFQWNRAYLLTTFALSLGLPWVRIEALKTTITQENVFYPEFLWQLSAVEVTPVTETSFWEVFSLYEWLFFMGASVMTLWFSVKLYRIQQLRETSVVKFYPNYTKVVVKKSEVAFSFFKQVFLGDAIPKAKEPKILAHELVHIKQWHSLDLLFFELLRIVFWFNPMVYVYQNRMADLHEFIADSKVAKTNKKEQYQLLLSEAFQTQNLSFVNQFFKKSLIKKRIVMLTKQKSKSIYQLKYILLLPLVFGMLVYSSCEKEVGPTSKFSESVSIEGDLITFKVYDLDNLTEEERLEHTKILENVESEGKTGQLKIMDSFERHMRIVFSDGIIQSIDVKKNEDIKAVPFGVIDEVPIFPGCENAANKKACFQEKMIAHIKKHFNYPKKAQDLGIQGRVSIMFTIDEAGNITNIRKRGPHELLENETERIINRLPKMTPGKQGGEVVKVPFSIPVTFKLDEEINNFELISPETFDNESDEIRKNIARYNKLITERRRLLQSANEDNPVIKSLDDQLILIRIEIRERLNVLMKNK